MKRNALLILMLVVISARVFAGWEITLKETDPDGTINYQTMLIDNNRVKSSDPDGGFIFDVKSGAFIMIDNQGKTYWKGNLSDFREKYYKAMKGAVEQMLANLPPEQQEMYKQMFGDMVEIYAEPDKSRVEALNVNIDDTGETTDIAGYKSTKYLVNVDGNLVEQIWLSDGLDISGDLDLKAMINLMNEIRPNLDDEFLYEYSDAYIDLWEKGFRMKSIDKEGDISEVIKAEKKNIADAEFQPPAGFRQQSIEEMMQQQMMSENGEE